MSVVVALKDKDRIVVGVDIRTSCDAGMYFDSYKARPKAVHFDKEKTVIGAAVGNCSLLEVLQSIYDKSSKDRDLIDRSYIVRRFIPELITMAERRELINRNDNGLDGEVMLLIKNKGFIIGGNYNVFELDEFCAIGCGGPSALASLFTSKGLYSNPENRIVTAIKAAAYTDNKISDAVYIGSTAGETFKYKDNKKR